MKDVYNLVQNYWDDGYNCSSCTSGAILSFFNDRDKDKILKMLNFYDNVGHENTLCGAFLGTILSMSKQLSNKHLSEKEIKLRLGMVEHQFLNHYKSINCHSILSNFRDAKPDNCSSNNISNCYNLILNSVLMAIQVLHLNVITHEEAINL